jgi:death-on-curing protein
MSPRFLSMGEVLLILQDQIRRYGGEYGIRDVELLSSALAMPQTTFGGHYLHADLFEQAAAYAFHICQNLPFIDGNKRTALATALVFFDLNGMELADPEDKLYRLMLDVAVGKSNKPQIAETFRALSKKKPREFRKRSGKDSRKKTTT